MQKITDYVFSNSWQVKELKLKQGLLCRFVQPLKNIPRGAVMQFVGFEDVDNHFGRFVFMNKAGEIVELPGDFSGRNSLSELKSAMVPAE